MGKINRLGEASHVTTIVDGSGKPEIIHLQPENEYNTEQVEYDEDGKRLDRIDDTDKAKDDNDDKREVDDRDDNAKDEGDFSEQGGTSDPATSNDPTTEGLTGGFKASGSADVVEGEQPPVDKAAEDVKSWVGDDYVKAERALAAEKAARNRSGLVTWLEKVARQR